MSDPQVNDELERTYKLIKHQLRQARSTDKSITELMKPIKHAMRLDRQKHELDARLNEISHVFGIEEPHTDIHGKHPKVISISERKAELKKEREALDG